MGMKLKDILQMAEMKDVYVLAGDNGINRMVKSITVMDAPDGIEFFKGGELVLTTMYPFSHLTNGLEDVIQGLALRNVSGLGLKLDRYVKSLPDKVIAVANEYEFPIISLPTDKAWIDLMIPIMSEILKINNRQLLRSKEINQHFTNALISNSTLQNVAELLYHYIENPVGIFNFTEDYTVVFPRSSMPSKEQIINHLKSDNTLFSVITADTRFSRISCDGSSYAIFSFENAFKFKGAIVIKEVNRRLTSEDTDSILHAKNAVLLKIMQIQTENEYHQRIKQELISRLLVEKIGKDDISRFRRRAWETGIELKDHYEVAIMTFYKRSFKVFYKIMEDLNHHFDKEIITGLDKENQVVLLLPVNSVSLHENRCIPHDTLNTIIRHISENYSGYKWAIGVSQVNDVYSIPVAYQQAVKSLYLGIKIGGYGQVQYYDTLGIYRLFSHPALQEEIKLFVNELLSPLRNHDGENQTELVKTLRIFIENRGNYRKTAQLLHVHHNTVRYRINMICKLSNFDIHNNHILLQYQLAYLLFPLLKMDGNV